MRTPSSGRSKVALLKLYLALKMQARHFIHELLTQILPRSIALLPAHFHRRSAFVLKGKVISELGETAAAKSASGRATTFA
jgi:hypothetical protein